MWKVIGGLQIPRFHRSNLFLRRISNPPGRNNHLEKVLSVFDQTHAYEEDKRVLKVDESQYAGDDEMEYIVHRLQSAAADPEMGYQMNAEAEFFKALEDRDTAIMEQAKLIEQKDAELL